MMKVLIILFSICLTAVTCLSSVIFECSFNPKFDNSKDRYPWVVVIQNDTVQFYGSIVHERAVLTLAVIDTNRSYSNFRVYYDFYKSANDLSNNQINYRRIQEYNIIESYKHNYQQNLAILIVNKPFPPLSVPGSNPRLIELAEYQDDFNDKDCIILSLGDFTIDKFDFVTFVNSMKGTFDEFGLFSIDYYDEHVYDEQDQSKLPIIYNGGMEAKKNIIGGPIVCRSENSKHHWVQVSVANATILLSDYNFSQQIWTRPLTCGIPIRELVKKFLQNSFIN